MMKIFGTIFPFVEPNDQDFRMGRFVANYDFLVALLNHSRFDSFHLFCLNPQHLQATAQRLTQDNTIDAAAKSKIQLFLYSTLREKLASETYHAFHLGGWGYFFAGLADLRSRYAQSLFPITGVIHSLNAREARFDYYKLLRAPLIPCDAVVCTSKAGRQVMKKQLDRISALENTPPYRGQLPIIPLGVSDHNLPDRATCRAALGLDADTIALLYIGRLSPNTKADLYPLLVCFKQLLAQSPQPLKLFLAGGASKHEQSLHQDIIRELELETPVMLLPNFDPAMKWQLYAAADISVAPADNLQETFGISIIESMQAGLPVVAADINGYRDLIDDEVDGFRIRTIWIDEFELAAMDEIMSNDSLQTLLAQAMVIDLDQLQTRLLTLIENPELRQRMGEHGCQKVMTNYLWPMVIEQYQALWDQLHAQAQQCELPASDSSFFSNDYLGGFSHYPSTILSESMQVTLTDAGRQCLQSSQTPPIYSDVAMALDQDWLTRAMTELINGSKGVGELLAAHGDTGNRGRFSLLWATKYGLLKLD